MGKTLILYFYLLESLSNPTDQNKKSQEIYINYFETLESAITKFNEIKKPKSNLTKLYNQYGQEIPLNYNVQKTGLKVYYQIE